MAKQFEFQGQEIKVANLQGGADLPAIPTGPAINIDAPSGGGPNPYGSQSANDILDNLFSGKSDAM